MITDWRLQYKLM